MEKIKNSRRKQLKVILAGFIAINLLVGCGKDNNQVAETEQITEIDNNEMTETNKTLKVYNEYLEQIGSLERMTEQELDDIARETNPHTISIKLNNGNYSQVGLDYNIISNANNNIKLIMPDFITGLETYDMFTGTIITDYTGFDQYQSLNNCISENDINPIGYTTQKSPAWDDTDKEYIRQNYGEEVLNCLQELGFPLYVYDVNSFYEVYNHVQETVPVR